MGVGGGALGIRWCTNFRRFIYDRTHFILLQLPMDVQLIGPELVGKLKLREENMLIHKIQTLDPT